MHRLQHRSDAILESLQKNGTIKNSEARDITRGSVIAVFGYNANTKSSGPPFLFWRQFLNASSATEPNGRSRSDRLLRGGGDPHTARP
jgi:hypothetical protein